MRGSFRVAHSEPIPSRKGSPDPAGAPGRRPGLLARALLWLLTHTIYRLSIHGADNVPLHGGAFLVSRHSSFADALFISAALPRPVRHLVWRGYLEARWLGWITRALSSIPVAATDAPRQLLHALRDARRAIRGGQVVGLSVEGSLGRDGQRRRFPRVMERIARGTGAPIVPVVVDRPWGGITRVREGRLSWRWPLELPQRVRVIFGPALPSTASVARVRREVQELHAEAFRRRRTSESLPAHFVDTARSRLFTFALSDHTGRQLSFRRALAGALALSWALKKRLGPEPNAGVLLPPSAGGTLTNIALSFLGKVPVNLNYTAGPAQVERCVERAGLADIITSRVFLAKLGWPDGALAAGNGAPRNLSIEELARGIGRWSKLKAYLTAQLMPAALIKRLFVAPADPNSPAAILFSSGTTGEPKGIVQSHFNILSNIQALDQVFDVSPNDRIVGVLPFFHSFGLTASLWLPMIVGFGALYHPNPLDARAVGRLVREGKGTLFMAPPTFFQLYLRQCEPEDFRSLRYAVCGAEKLKRELARAFEQKFGLPLLEGYGCTELSPVATVNVFEAGDSKSEDWKPGSIGRPLPGVAVKVVDPESGQDLPEGADGLLLVKGPNVMLGYLDDPVLTKEAIRDGWYVTGDIARLDHEGFLEITDRLARFSKIAGEMVPHLRIEEALAGLAPSAEFVVTTLPSESKGERLAVIHTPLPSEISPAGLEEKLRRSGLPNLWIPRSDSYLEVEALPRTGIGKIDLKSVKALARDRLGGVGAGRRG